VSRAQRTHRTGTADLRDEPAQAVAVQLDVESEESVRTAALTVAASGVAHLDLLINNAGWVFCEPECVLALT